eukprot:scaffold16044_cov160-Amphora_coffeaeformis.AAC.1
MPTISRLRRHKHRGHPRRQTILRIGVVVGVLGLLGLVMTVMHPSSSSSSSSSLPQKNHVHVMSPSHLLRQQQQTRTLMEQRRQAKHNSTNEDNVGTKKNDEKQENVDTKDTTTSSPPPPPSDPEPEDTQDGSIEEEEEEIVEEVDKEEEEDALDAGDGAHVEELSAETTTTTTTTFTTTTTATTTAATTTTATTTTATTKADTTVAAETTEAPPTEAPTTAAPTTAVPTTTTPTIAATKKKNKKKKHSDTKATTKAQDDDDDDADESTTADDDWDSDDAVDSSENGSEDNTPEKTPQESFDEEAKKEKAKHKEDGDESGLTEPEELALPVLESRTYFFQFSNLVHGKKESRHGTVTIITHPEWAPIGVKHFHELVEDGYYSECRVFRVLPNFVAQFGINADPAITAEAQKVVLKDDPVMQTNARGTLSYATSGPNSRTTQVFFNLREEGNDFLDKQGFAPFAEVVDGMDVLDRIFAEYGEFPSQAELVRRGQPYLDENFPKLSFIKHIWMEEKEKEDEAS